MISDLPRKRSLTVQILFLLSLALLPLGAIAAWQTQRISTQAEQQLETALLLHTERAAGQTRLLAERGLGAIRALRAAGQSLLTDPDRCSSILLAFAETSQTFSAFQFTAPDGSVICSSGEPLQPTTALTAAERGDDGAPFLQIRRSEGAVDRYALTVTQPVTGAEGVIDAYISVTIPNADLSVPALQPPSKEPYGLVTFDAQGTVLTTTFDEGVTTANLPADRELPSLVDNTAQVFRGETAAGEDRTFAVVPLMPGIAYAMASWPRDALSDNWFDRLAADAFLPLLMWIATLMVAFIALERLVIRHIRVLSRQMRTFARTRRLVSKPVLLGAGSELSEIENDFRDMAQSILQDEAQLENNLREKNVLLKEVHHRVKNNLQLITSIMNMQIRRVKSDEARTILRRLHERIMSLALVHRALYQTPEMNKIDAADLVVELGNKLVAAANRTGRVTLRPDVSQVELFPEQAVPLSLLVTEALTNAIEHAEVDPEGRVEIRLSFHAVNGKAKLAVESAVAAEVETKSSAPERGLGHQLIRAFETQLGGTLEMGEDDGTYRVHLSFPVRTQDAEVRDY